MVFCDHSRNTMTQWLRAQPIWPTVLNEWFHNVIKQPRIIYLQTLKNQLIIKLQVCQSPCGRAMHRLCLPLDVRDSPAFMCEVCHPTNEPRCYICGGISGRRKRVRTFAVSKHYRSFYQIGTTVHYIHSSMPSDCLTRSVAMLRLHQSASLI